MSRKDSKGMFAAVLGQLGEGAPGPKPSAPRTSSPHLLKVAAGVRELQDRHTLVDKMLGEGEHILEFDPIKIEPSPITDRFEGAYSDEAISEIAASMRESGQVVPGMVRPLDGGRYQIVYGRRRLAAAAKLGLKFKAIVRELDDDEAIVRQGAENAGREELTFIEKCAFARAQERGGFRRDTICASLATGKSHVSEMIKIVSAIPDKVLAYIGPAPAVGRGRWSELATLLQSDAQIHQALECAASGTGPGNSDGRFNKILSDLQSGKHSKQSRRQQGQKWTADDGKFAVSFKSGPDRTTVALEREEGAAFGTWFSKNLKDLYAAYKRDASSKSQETN